MPKAKLSVRFGQISLKLQEKASLAQQLVTECMVVAGRVASKFAAENSLLIPFLYHLGVAGLSPPPNRSSSLLEMCEALPLLLPSAVDLAPRRHEALGLDSYCKATSPLRRANDLITHFQISSKLYSKDVCFTKDQLKSLCRDVYHREQYNKRLMSYSNRFWTFRFIQQEFDRHGNLHIPCTVVGSDGNKVKLYLEPYAMIYVGSFSGSSQLSLGQKILAELIHVDPYRMSMEFVLCNV